ncbi:MAG: RluA family pseudouridine synthase [Pseudomonadota bacterium]|nr:RluA family pseudouridine synthase [Pseudomonadota bacterium]
MPTAESRPSAEYVRVNGDLEGQRIDNFLMGRIKGVPRSHLYRVLRRGEVRVNKGRVKPSYRLRQGDWVRIPPLRTAEASPPPRLPEAELRRLEGAVLFEDDRLIAVNKPTGLAVHGGSGLSYGLIEAMRALRPRLKDLELVHRLDRETSGCLLLSKRRSTLRELHRLIRANAVDKRYIALLAGRLPRQETRVDAALRKNLLRSGERVVRVDAAEGKPARTIFRRLRQFGDLTLVEAELITGRTHQIRVHAAHLGAPVAGDEKYGNAEANRHLRQSGLRRLFLHAAALTFHPEYRDRPLSIQAPLPPELEAVIADLEQKL